MASIFIAKGTAVSNHFLGIEKDPEEGNGHHEGKQCKKCRKHIKQDIQDSKEPVRFNVTYNDLESLHRVCQEKWLCHSRSRYSFPV